jgi:hypothetical protein
VNPRRRCIFCGNDAAKMSGEHIWSAWIGRLFPGASFQWRFADPETGETRSLDLDELSFTVNCVCKPCNEGWLSQLEGRSKAAFSGMIRDEVELSLLPAGSAVLAAFAFKSAVVANCINKSRAPFFTPATRSSFKDSLKVPDAVQMWLARFSNTSGFSGLFSGHVLGMNVPKGSPFYGLELYSFTYVAGRLVLQVLAPRWAYIVQQGKPLPRLRPSPAWDDAAILFWPDLGLPIGWPPTKGLGDDTINQFIDRWMNPLTTF